MSKVKRAFYLQLAGSLLAAIFVLWIWRHYPVVRYTVELQQRIGAMEFWGAVLYPLLVAACNVLLLPGGVLAVGSGLFFGLWWGFFLNVGEELGVVLGRFAKPLDARVQRWPHGLPQYYLGHEIGRAHV